MCRMLLVMSILKIHKIEYKKFGTMFDIIIEINYLI